MKKLILLTAAAVLGISLSSGAFAYTISGTVYFDESSGEEAVCTDIYLYSGSNCINQIDATATTCCGAYSFEVGSGEYSIKVVFTNIDCAACDFSGTCSYKEECKNVSVGGTSVILNFDLDLPYCDNSENCS
jgi:hypothetical protein